MANAIPNAAREVLLLLLRGTHANASRVWDCIDSLMHDKAAIAGSWGLKDGSGSMAVHSPRVALICAGAG